MHTVSRKVTLDQDLSSRIALPIVIGASAGVVVGVSLGVANSNPVLMIGGPILGLLAGSLAAVLIYAEGRSK